MGDEHDLKRCFQFQVKIDMSLLKTHYTWAEHCGGQAKLDFGEPLATVPFL